MRREIHPARLSGQRLKRLTKEFLRSEDGATAIEYGVIASMVFLAIIASVKAFSGNTSAMYTDIAETLEDG